MLLIDPREGSKEILDYIMAIQGHPPVEHCTMDYGDVMFVGDGPNGPMTVGLEVKTLNDVLNCIETGRFTGHQLPGLKQTYDVVYLAIVGEYRSDWETGSLQIKLNKGNGSFWWSVKTGKREWSHYEFMAWLTMVELGWGIRVRESKDMKDLSRTLVEMYKVVQKPWSEHKTLNPFFLGPVAGNTTFTKPTLVERVVAQVEGIGPAKAREIGKRFPTVAGMVNSALDNKPAWKDIPGIGKPTATRILQAFWES